MDCSRTKPSMKVKDSNTSKHQCPLQEGEPKEPPPECLQPSCHISSSVHLVRQKGKYCKVRAKSSLEIEFWLFFQHEHTCQEQRDFQQTTNYSYCHKAIPSPELSWIWVSIKLPLSKWQQQSPFSIMSPQPSCKFTKLQAEDFLQIPLWVELGAIYQNREHNFIWKVYRLSNFYSESRLCFHLPLTRPISIGGFFLPPPFFLFIFFFFLIKTMLTWLTINHFSFSTIEYISGILCKKYYYYEE